MILGVLGGSFLEPDPIGYFFGSGIGTNIGASIIWGLVAGFIGYLLARKLKAQWGRLHQRIDRLHERHDEHAKQLARIGKSLIEVHEKLDAQAAPDPPGPPPAVGQGSEMRQPPKEAEPMLVTRTITEHVVEGRRLGRHVAHDPLSRSALFAADGAAQIVDVTHASRGLPLTQVRGSCTAEALIGKLDTQPSLGFRRGAPLGQPDAEALYDREISDEGHDPATDDPGGSGLMVCKAAQQLGLIRSYKHAFGRNQALLALVVRPVMIGANWYDSMDAPDADGVVTISPGAQVRGGHEWVATEINVEAQLIGAWNSWGPGWGLAGRFYVPFAVLDRLLAEQGDVTVPYL